MFHLTGNAADFSLQFLKPTEHGMVAGIRLPTSTDFPSPPMLTHEEKEFVERLPPLRRASFAGGRIALRCAATQLGCSLGTVLPGNRGAPTMPHHLVGSISHKTLLAVALVDKCTEFSVGIDLEDLSRSSPKIARLVLRPEEKNSLEKLAPEFQWQAIATRFSIKEAVFKAIDPFVNRYVAFSEASVQVRESGDAIVQLHLRHDEGPFAVQAAWFLVQNHILSTVRIRRV